MRKKRADMKVTESKQRTIKGIVFFDILNTSGWKNAIGRAIIPITDTITVALS